MSRLHKNRRLAGGIFGQVVGQQNAPEKSQPKSHPILTTPALASRVQKSLVIITTQDSHGDAVALGSGFFLTPELVATNLHVLKRSSQAIVKSGLDRIPHPVKEVVAFSLIHDVCVLYVPGAAGSPIPVSGSPVHIGDEILVAGNLGARGDRLKGNRERDPERRAIDSNRRSNFSRIKRRSSSEPKRRSSRTSRFKFG